MTELPIMPVKTDAVLSDNAYMSAEQFGAFRRISYFVWRAGGMLADNDAELARIAGLSLRRWRKNREPILRAFTTVQGMISHAGDSETRLNVQELRRKRAAAATSMHRQKAHANVLQKPLQNDANQNQIKIDSNLLQASLQRMNAPRLPLGPVMVKK
jgi:uncharacterized protein YdaU (DUF1376 family)